MRCLGGMAGSRIAACAPVLALCVAAAAWAVPPPDVPTPKPALRIGLRQGAPSVTISCPVGVRVRDAQGQEVLRAARAVRVEPAEAGASPAPPSARAREALVEGETPPPSPPEQTPSPGAAVPAPAEKPVTAPLPALLLVTALDPGEQARGSVSLPCASVEVLPRDGETPLDFAKMRYRGALVVERDRRGKLSAVNAVSVEDYLRGVLPAEMSPSSPLEALKAQAIVARTFAVAARDRHRGAGYDLCDTTHCQVYGGAARERETTDRAVAETRGQVLLSDGRPVPAYFHSTCGGATATPAEVWGGSEGPACVAGVPDFPALPDEDLSSEASLLTLAVRGSEVFCGASPEFHWEVERTRADLEKTLSRTLPEILRKAFRLGSLQGLAVVSRTRTGRVAVLEVRGSEGSCLLRGDAIRSAFGSGGEMLRSTRFVVRPIAAPDAPEGAAPESYRFLGFGSGHGVGLCQMGAIGMARLGHDAGRILAHYFPGATVGALEAEAP